jgi:type II secretory pathway pseudopilin PulG
VTALEAFHTSTKSALVPLPMVSSNIPQTCRYSPRRRRRIKAPWWICWTLLLSRFVGQCAAKNQTTDPATITPFPENVTTPVPVDVSTPAPVPVVTSYDTAEAWFVLLFNLESVDPNAGLWNETEATFLKAAMEGLTQEFAPDDWEKVVTMCILHSQALPNSSAPETIDPSFVANTSVSVVKDVSNASKPTAVYSYEYVFQMKYISSSVNVSYYPMQLEDYINDNIQDFQERLQTVLEVPPEANLQITSFQSVTQITLSPTVATLSPTISPTVSSSPSQTPSISSHPTSSAKPSSLPSFMPTQYPSLSPSMMPTNYPTFEVNTTASDNFALDYTLQALEGAGYLNTSQEEYFCALMENQTHVFAPKSAARVLTQCLFLEDTYTKRSVVVTTSPSLAPSLEPSTVPEQTRRLQEGFSPLRGTRELQDPYTTTIYTYTYKFRMRYSSDTVDVTGYNEQFPSTIAANANEINTILTNLLGLTPSNNLTLFSIAKFEEKSAVPTESAAPSIVPTSYPTQRISQYPTGSLTFLPTASPTGFPSIPPSELPSFSPSPAPDDDDKTTTIVVVVVVALFASITMLGMARFYRNRRQVQKEEANKVSLRRKQNEPSEGNGLDEFPTRKVSHNSEQGQRYDQTVATSPNSHTTAEIGGQYPNAAQLLVMSPSTSESILSNPSLLSNGHGDDDVDEDEHDDDDDFPQARFSTIDDFDQFKDHNIEKMRSCVQESVAGMDGMLSQALTMAILGGPSYELPESCDGIEMETNIIWEVNDWLKRNDYATQDER